MLFCRVLFCRVGKTTNYDSPLFLRRQIFKMLKRFNETKECCFWEFNGKSNFKFNGFSLNVLLECTMSLFWTWRGLKISLYNTCVVFRQSSSFACSLYFVGLCDQNSKAVLRHLLDDNGYQRHYGC